MSDAARRRGGEAGEEAGPRRQDDERGKGGSEAGLRWQDGGEGEKEGVR